jgi:hypothetical protein
MQDSCLSEDRGAAGSCIRAQARSRARPRTRVGLDACSDVEVGDAAGAGDVGELVEVGGKQRGRADAEEFGGSAGGGARRGSVSGRRRRVGAARQPGAARDQAARRGDSRPDGQPRATPTPPPRGASRVHDVLPDRPRQAKAVVSGGAAAGKGGVGAGRSGNGAVGAGNSCLWQSLVGGPPAFHPISPKARLVPARPPPLPAPAELVDDDEALGGAPLPLTPGAPCPPPSPPPPQPPTGRARR